MKQKICMAAAICIAIAGTLLFSFQRAQEVEAKVGKTQQALAEEVFRFHVVADSDSREDQAIKQKVRDAVLEEMKDQMPESGIKSAGDTEKWAVEERTTETGKQFVLVAKSTSGVKSTESEDRVRIYTQSGNICVESEAGDVIRLYSTSGQLLKSETARQGLTLIEALPGTYVIEVAGQSTTIVNY